MSHSLRRGWEPIDAYRKLLEQYEARKAFVVHDPALREAVYSYFKNKFVYADEKKARFYFEKPYRERTPEQMKAAGMQGWTRGDAGTVKPT